MALLIVETINMQDHTWKKLSIKDTEQPSNNADSLDKVLIKIDATLLQIWKQVFVASDFTVYQTRLHVSDGTGTK